MTLSITCKASEMDLILSGFLVSSYTSSSRDTSVMVYQLLYMVFMFFYYFFSNFLTSGNAICMYC